VSRAATPRPAWNEYSFHALLKRRPTGRHLHWSGRVRRQGLEPRTRGLREGSCGALSALPAQTQQTCARKALSAHSPHGFRSTRRSTPPHPTARELATESDAFGPPDCRATSCLARWDRYRARPAARGSARARVFEHLVFKGGTALRKLYAALSRVLGATATSPPRGPTLSR
jgi:hypothetical protein